MPSKAAEHLMDAVWRGQENFRMSMQTMETDMKVIARNSLDDAGLRVAVEKLEFTLLKENAAKLPTWAVLIITQALAALNGEQP